MKTEYLQFQDNFTGRLFRFPRPTPQPRLSLTAGVSAMAVALTCASGAFAADPAQQPPNLFADQGQNPPPAPPPPATANRPKDEITVTAIRRSSLPKLTEPLLRTPQVVVTIPPGLLGEEGITSLQDALRNSSDVSAHGNQSTRPGTGVDIRGFETEFSTYLDGLLDQGPYPRDAFFLENIEVFTGPSSVLFGRGSTGGAINQNSKKPHPGDSYAFSSQFGTDDTRRLATDDNFDFGNGWAFRFNGVLNENGTARRDKVFDQRTGLFPAVSYDGTPFRMNLSWLHQSDWGLPDLGTPWMDYQGRGQPAPAPWKANYGFAGDYSRTTADVATLVTEYDLADGVTLRNQLRHANYDLSYRFVEGNVPGILPANVDFATVLVKRTVRSGFQRQDLVADALDLHANFETFGLTHKLVAGFEFDRQASSPTIYSFSGVPMVPLLGPDPDGPFVGTQGVKQRSAGRIYTDALYLIDSITLGDWELLASARGDRFDASWKTYTPTSSVAQHSQFRHIDVQPSFRTALIYNLASDISLYAAYGTSFDPAAEGFSLSAANAALAPEESNTIEVGAKWQPREKLLATLAFFRTEKTNMRETDPLNPTVALLAGDGFNEGVDLQIGRKLSDAWDLTLGYTYLHSAITKSPANDLGARLKDAPMHRVALWVSYETGPWELSAGMQYASDRAASSLLDSAGFQQYAPSFATASAQIGYAFSKTVKVQANIYNLSDERYFDGVDDAHVLPGAGRSVSFTTKVRF